MAHKSGAFHLDSSDEKLEVSVSESDTDFTVEIVATLNGRLSDLTFIYCRTSDQVRALVPGFKSEAEKATEVTATPEAGPFQVGDKVRVLRVPGIRNNLAGVPYESVVVECQIDGLLVRPYDEDYGGWSVGLTDVELIASAETAEVPA